MAAEAGGALGGLVRQLSIDQFENEGRRVSYGTPESASHARRLLDRQTSVSGVQKKVCFYPLLTFLVFLGYSRNFELGRLNSDTIRSFLKDPIQIQNPKFDGNHYVLLYWRSSLLIVMLYVRCLHTCSSHEAGSRQ